jgi:hypothetical protein
MSSQRKPAISPRRRPARARCQTCRLRSFAMPHRTVLRLIRSECFEFSSPARYAINQYGNVSRHASLGNQLRENLREGTKHVVAGARAPRLARPATGSFQAGRAELHDQFIDVPSDEILNGQVAQLAANGLQDVFITCGCRGPNFVARLQPIRAGLFHCKRGWLHVGADIYLALDLCKSRPLPSRSGGDGAIAFAFRQPFPCRRSTDSARRACPARRANSTRRIWGGSWRRSAMSVKRYDAASVCAAMKR